MPRFFQMITSFLPQGELYVPPPGYPFSPSDVAGLKFWLKADQITASDNDPVSTWEDQSGNGYDLTAILTARPTYKTNIKNSLPVARFDGFLNKMETATTIGNIITVSSFSLFYVLNIKAFGSDGATPTENEGIFNDTTSYFGLGIKSSNTSVGVENYSGGVTQTSKTGLSADTWYIVHARHESGNLYISVNNGSENSVASGDTGNVAGNLRIGANYSALFAEIDVAEVVCYNVAVAAGDRTNIFDYLNTKWAVY